jgi:F420 biosynthesis protein FbiB-like protein
MSAPVLETLRSRRSVRRFLPDPVPPEIVTALLEAACAAPSAHNAQPWRFAVLASAQARQGLAEALGVEFRRDLLADGLSAAESEAQVQRSQQRIGAAPLAILLCLDSAAIDAYPDAYRQEAARMMAVQSAALAGGSLLLAAHALGLGGVWMCAPLFAPQTAAAALNLPAGWQPQALILLGYPAAPGRPTSRRPSAELAVYR